MSNRKSGRVACTFDACMNRHRSVSGLCADHREQISVLLGATTGQHPPMVRLKSAVYPTPIVMTVGEATRFADTIIDTIEGLQAP